MLGGLFISKRPMLPDVYKFIILCMVAQEICTLKHYDADLFICPDSTSNEAIECDAGEVIDIVYALFSYTKYPFPCTGNTTALIPPSSVVIPCQTELPFSTCHGNSRCTVTSSMAKEFIACPPTNPMSDILYVRYNCHEFDPLTRMQLPFSRDYYGEIIDVLSPDFPDRIPAQEYNVTCTITPQNNAINNDLDLYVKTKLLSYNGTQGAVGNLDCVESLDMTQGEETRPLLCYYGVFNEKREHDEDPNPLSGKQWKLHYHRQKDTVERGKFWIQFRATTEGRSGAPVNLQVSCENHLAEITTTIDPETTSSPTDPPDYLIWIIVGVVGFVVVVILIVLIVFCVRRRRKLNGEKAPTATEASAPPKEGVGVYCIAGPIDEKHGEANGKVQNDKKARTPRYMNVDQPNATYAEIDKKKKSKNKGKGKKDKTKGSEDNEVEKAADDDTIMVENNTLYGSAKGKEPGKVEYAEIKIANTPVKAKPYNETEKTQYTKVL